MAALEVNRFFNSNNLSDQETNEYENADEGADILRLDHLTISQDHQSTYSNNFDEEVQEDNLDDTADDVRYFVACSVLTVCKGFVKLLFFIFNSGIYMFATNTAR
jgi:hypothetical protein